MKIIEEDKKYIPIKPPAGTIFVGKDMKTGWISNINSFYDSNIQFVNVDSKLIKFK